MSPLRLLALVLISTPIARAASGGAPITVSQGGYLLDASDAPFDGAVPLTFRVVDAASAGAVQWEGACAAVPVHAGYYAVLLGGSDCTGSTANGLDATLDTADLPAGSARWLEVVVDGVVMDPRLAITAAPTAALASRALEADALQGHPASHFALVSSLAPVATSGHWNDLVGKPAFAPVATSGHWNDLVGKPTFAPVATSGAYGDLSGRLPAATGTTDGYLTATDWTAFNGKLGTTTGAGGDVTGTFGSLTVGKLRGNAIATATPLAGQVLTWVGSEWTPQTPATVSSQWTTTGANLYYLTGNVGIGTSTPGSTLDLRARTDGVNLPAGTSAQRPGSSPAGTLRYNTSLNKLEYFNGSAWISLGSAFSATGGTVQDIGGNRIHTFTSSSTFVSSGNGIVSVLIIGGGGGGGRYGGGGGAGQFVYNAAYAVGIQNYTVTVGNGGAGWVGDAQSGGQAGAGQQSAFGPLTAAGGGGGGNYGNNSCSAGASGASGGGGGCNNISGCGGGTGTAGSNGSAGSGSVYLGGAGGGAGQAGGAGGAGRGGDGLSSSISGTLTFYAGGGGGGGNGYGANGTNVGGQGGGGHGARANSAMTASDIDGAANTGGGGGGGADNNVGGTTRAGNGGSGIVIVSYPL